MHQEAGLTNIAPFIYRAYQKPVDKNPKTPHKSVKDEEKQKKIRKGLQRNHLHPLSKEV
jgi:hypothetical protein